MPLVDLGDIRVHYEDSGAGESGENVFLLHGFTVDGRSWPNALGFLRPRYRVIVPDARGHGKSEAPPTGYSRDQRAEDLLRLADILKIDRFHLVGMSMGGSTAIGFALKHGERLLSLSLVSTGAAGFQAGKKLNRIDELVKSDGVETGMEKWIEWALAYYRNKKPAVAKLLEMMMREHGGAMWADPMRGKYPRTNDLDRVHGINVATMIFSGGQDRVFVPLAEQLNERIPDSRLTLYEDVGHMINLEIPDRFYADLTLFLGGVAAR